MAHHSQRVTVAYLYDLGGHAIAEVNSSGAWTRSEVYAGSRHVATYRDGPTGTTYFSHTDWLGTERVRTDKAGTTVESCTSLPFGDAQSCTDSSTLPFHFTGKERDTESGLDFFIARHFGSALGRFNSPDPGNAGAIENDPQSWNAYAYARNNPLNYLDPDGLRYNICVVNSEQNGMTCSEVFDPDFETLKDNPGPGIAVMGDESGGVIYAWNSKSGWTRVGTYMWVGNDNPGIDALREAGRSADRELKADLITMGLVAAEQAVFRGIGLVVEAVAARQATRAGAEVTFKHGARHLVGTGLEQATVENVIKADVQQIAATSSTTGEFWGKVVVNGKEILYRAFTKADGTIEVGTYYVP